MPLFQPDQFDYFLLFCKTENTKQTLQHNRNKLFDEFVAEQIQNNEWRFQMDSISLNLPQQKVKQILESIFIALDDMPYLVLPQHADELDMVRLLQLLYLHNNNSIKPQLSVRAACIFIIK